MKTFPIKSSFLHLILVLSFTINLNVYSMSSQQNTANDRLWSACVSLYIEGIINALKEGANPNYKKDRDPVLFAVLDRPFGIHPEELNKISPIEQAVNLLVKSGADVNACNDIDLTPVAIIYRMFRRPDISGNTNNLRCKTTIYNAIYKSLSESINPSDAQNAYLMYACCKKDQDRVKQALSNGADANYTESGYSLLMQVVLAYTGNPIELSIVQSLIAAGADPRSLYPKPHPHETDTIIAKHPNLQACLSSTKAQENIRTMQEFHIPGLQQPSSSTYNSLPGRISIHGSLHCTYCNENLSTPGLHSRSPGDIAILKCEHYYHKSCLTAWIMHPASSIPCKNQQGHVLWENDPRRDKKYRIMRTSRCSRCSKPIDVTCILPQSSLSTKDSALALFFAAAALTANRK